MAKLPALTAGFEDDRIGGCNCDAICPASLPLQSCRPPLYAFALKRAASIQPRGKPGGNPRARTRWCVLALLLAGGLAYSNSLSGPFVFDDRTAIVDNPRIHTLADANRLTSLRGLVDFSFAVNDALGGLNPLGYHLINLGIHLCAGLTLFGLVRRTLKLPKLAPRLLRAAADSLALAIALLWLVHPLTTQAVTYVCQRYESAAALFYLLGLYAFCRSCETDARRRSWLALVVLCYACGLHCKETAISFPLVLLWYDRALIAGSWSALWTRKAFYGVLCLATVLLAGATLAPTVGTLAREVARSPATPAPAGQQHKGDVLIVDGLTPVSYLLSQPGVILHYLQLSVWPVGQCFDYDWPVARGAGQILPPLVAVLGLLTATAWADFRHPPAAFLAGAFFLFLAPTSSVLPIRDLMVEHRMYLPLAAVICLVVLGGFVALSRPRMSLASGQRHWRLGAAALGTAVVALGMLTWARNSLYASQVTLWEDTCQQAPHNSRTRMLLGTAYLAENRADEAREQFEIAAEQFQHKLALNPDVAATYCELAATVLPEIGPQ